MTSLSASRIDDLRLCLALETHPNGVPASLRPLLDTLRMEASNDTVSRCQTRLKVNQCVAQLGWDQYVVDNLCAPPEQETFSQMQAFLPNLFIGGAGAAFNKELLLSHGITHVCMCLPGQPPFPSAFSYFVVAVLDYPEVDISPYFEDSYAFIKEAVKSGGKVLIHCAAGISRSGSIAIAYLMRENKITYSDALEVVRAARQFVCPNTGFKEQLLRLEAQIM